MEEKRTISVSLLVVLLAMLLMTLYVASFGPVGAYVDSLENRHAHLLWFRTFYHPLYWLAEHSPVLDNWLFWYVRWWMQFFN